MSIYVELVIAGPLDDLWSKTQTPELHQRWDLRFTSIEYLPHPEPMLPQRFLYLTRLGFGLSIWGEGETLAERRDAQGTRTSALKFWSDDPKSLILSGSGYWQYRPHPNGIQFLTRYDYSTRFGTIGRLADRLVFRPLLGWATAWSFDRLRLWIEHGVDPGVSLQRTLLCASARIVLATGWLYLGLHAQPSVVGWCAFGWGLALLVVWQRQWLWLVTLGLLLLALGSLLLGVPSSLTAPLAPAVLISLGIALSALCYHVTPDLPSARRCRRTPKEQP